VVKLQRRFAYRYKSKNGPKTHYKYIMTIPEEVVDELKWKEGTELKPKAQDQKLIVEAAPTAQAKKN
jgi:hypothetical protein